MTFRVNHHDRAGREDRIRLQVESSVDSEAFFDFRGARTNLRVIRIPVDLPVYRMANFRTFSDQESQIAKGRHGPGFFRNGQENESVQQAQHAILVALAHDGHSPIIEVLRREGQRENLLITSGGVVVNGNRRLAAMRELYSSDPDVYKQLGFVTCMVLPSDATSGEILDIEAALQARPETKLEYNWICDARLLKELLAARGSVEAVGRSLRRKTSEVANRLQSLDEAELYLREWRKRPGEYDLVAEDGEQFFKDLPGHLRDKSQELQAASRTLAWTLFDASATDRLDGRLHNYGVVYGRRAADTLDRVANELGLDLPEKASVDSAEFEFSVDDLPGEVSYAPVVAALSDPASRDDAIETLLEIAVSVVESDRSHKTGRAALKAVTAAHAKLAEVDLSRAADDTRDALRRQLDAIAKRADVLLAQLGKLTPPQSEK